MRNYFNGSRNRSEIITEKWNVEAASEFNNLLFHKEIQISKELFIIKMFRYEIDKHELH